MSESSPRRIALDANLLVLLVVGLRDRDLVAKHKRTQTFTLSDYDLLTASLEGYDRIVVTPNVLTECSNMVRQIGNPLATELTRVLGELIKTSIEVYCPSAQAAVTTEFDRLGLTDAGVLESIADGVPLLTTDAGLYVAALERGAAAENFNHWRMGSLLQG